MRRALPLLVDISVATLAGLRFHEELAGNFLPPVNLCRTREKISLWPVALVIHGCRSIRWVLNVRRTFPARVTRIPTCRAKGCECDQANSVAQRPPRS